MTGWDIDPLGVSGVLSKTGTAAKNMADAGTNAQTNLEGAASSAGTLTSQYGPYTSTAGVVGAALAQFKSHWDADLIYIARRTARSVNGAATATRLYVNGSQEQAANAQEEASKEPPKIDMPGQGQGPGSGESGRRTEGR